MIQFDNIFLYQLPQKWSSRIQFRNWLASWNRIRIRNSGLRIQESGSGFERNNYGCTALLKRKDWDWWLFGREYVPLAGDSRAAGDTPAHWAAAGSCRGCSHLRKSITYTAICSNIRARQKASFLRNFPGPDHDLPNLVVCFWLFRSAFLNFFCKNPDQDTSLYNPKNDAQRILYVLFQHGKGRTYIKDVLGWDT